jgi:lipopolysaccharide/colanic/teichoic acid biosynthesis glycosyltransferase
MTSLNGNSVTHSHSERNDVSVVSPWCNSRFKRICDFLGALALLILLLPLIALLSIVMKLTSRGPVLFRQRRPGRNGHEFFICKFRTMVVNGDQEGPVLTRADDPRVTRFGRYMRRWKLDELPQLLNVIRGEMSFVGPRPQPTRLWSEPAIQKEAAIVLSVRPGITSHATLAFRYEEELLAPLSAEEIEGVYLRKLMPLKLKMEIDYLREAGFFSDLVIIFKTAGRIFKRQKHVDEKSRLLEEDKRLLRAAGQPDAKPQASQVRSWQLVPEFDNIVPVSKKNPSAEETAET